MTPVSDSLKPQVSLAPLTTLGVGGEASFFLDAGSEDQVDAALDWAHKRGVSVTILGGGLIRQPDAPVCPVLIQLSAAINAERTDQSVALNIGIPKSVRLRTA